MATERETFLADRQKGIGGSDVAAIFGLDPYRTTEDLWLEKTGKVIPPDEPSGDKERGKQLEPFALKLFKERTGIEVVKILVPFTHPEYPWMRGNIDGAIYNSGGFDVAEVKCPSLGMYSKIKREGLPDSWKLQGQHYCFVTGAKRVTYIIFCADRWDLIHFTIDADPMIHEMLVEKEREFWQLVTTMTPPPEIIRHIKDEPDILTVGQVEKRKDADFIEAVSNLRESKALKKTAETLEEQAKAKIVDVVGKKIGIYESAGARIYYSESAGRETIDAKALDAANLISKSDAMLCSGLVLKAAMDGKPLDSKDLDTLFDSYVIDLKTYKKQGKGFTTLKAYFFGEN